MILKLNQFTQTTLVDLQYFQTEYPIYFQGAVYGTLFFVRRPACMVIIAAVTMILQTPVAKSSSRCLQAPIRALTTGFIESQDVTKACVVVPPPPLNRDHEILLGR